MRISASTRGFTLLELSIVLVIIGLIVGGVLVGRDLIRAAEMRATVKQVQEVDSAVNTFKLKYNCIPGDCLSASALGFTSYDGVSTINGDGDGFIATPPDEYWNSTHHLVEAGLIKATHGDIDNKTNIDYLAPPFALSSEGFKGYWVIAHTMVANSTTVMVKAGSYMGLISTQTGTASAAIITPFDAFAIDSKIDDGFPRSGATTASGNYYYGSFDPGPADHGPPGATSNVCTTNSDPHQYNVANQSRAPGSLCQLFIKQSY